MASTLGRINKIPIEVQIPDQLLNDILITALEQGIGYWADKITLIPKSGFGPRVERCNDMPLATLHAITVEPDNMGGCPNDPVNLRVERTPNEVIPPQMHEGLRIMAEKYPRHFANLISDHDADTADIFIQCCVFGEIVYS